MYSLEEHSNAYLRALPDVVIIYRSHVPWDASIDETVCEPVDLCQLKFIEFHLVRLRRDARGLTRASFTCRLVRDVTDDDLAAVRAHMELESEVHIYLRRLAREMSTQE